MLSVMRITHRPLFLQNYQGALELLTQPKKLGGCDIAFDELSRRVTVRSCDQERGVYTLSVYEGAADGAFAARD